MRFAPTWDSMALHQSPGWPNLALNNLSGNHI
jgi:hypothetical protein